MLPQGYHRQWLLGTFLPALSPFYSVTTTWALGRYLTSLTASPIIGFMGGLWVLPAYVGLLAFTWENIFAQAKPSKGAGMSKGVMALAATTVLGASISDMFLPILLIPHIFAQQYALSLWISTPITFLISYLMFGYRLEILSRDYDSWCNSL